MNVVLSQLPKALEHLFLAKGIKTIGDLSALSYKEACMLPITDAALRVVRVLNAYYQVLSKQRNDNIVQISLSHAFRERLNAILDYYDKSESSSEKNKLSLTQLVQMQSTLSDLQGKLCRKLEQSMHQMFPPVMDKTLFRTNTF